MFGLQVFELLLQKDVLRGHVGIKQLELRFVGGVAECVGHNLIKGSTGKMRCYRVG